MPDTENAPITVGPPPEHPKLPGGVIVPPPRAEIIDYPAAAAVAIVVLGAVALLLVVSRFDHSKGPLTVSLLIVLAMVGVVAFSLTVTIPRDETTAAVIGGLVTAFGGVVAYWLGRPRNGSPPPTP
jgi:hypothetical protein